MNKKYIYAALSVASMGLVACEDLDTTIEGDDVTATGKTEVVANDPSKAAAGVTAIFAQFNQAFPNKTALGAERHNDVGYPSIMMFTDANGEDMVSEDNGYNWAGNNLDFTDREKTSYEAQIIWNDYYSIIYCANAVVASSDVETELAEGQFFAAQGYAVRAFAYSELAQLFQFNIVGNESAPCVPIITNENSDQAALEGAPRATVQEVYDLVYSDINTAIALLEKSEAQGYRRGDKRYIDLATAYGIRARINLVCQKWADAAADATKAIEVSSAKPASIADVSRPSFWSMDEGNWMWGVLIAETDDVVETGICNWISHTGTFNYGYGQYSGGRQISMKLYNSISDTDVRKGWWTNEDGVSANLTETELEYMDSYGFKPYTQVKFAPYKNELETSVNANDVVLMRIEEMYLIKAEAEAKAGKDGLTTLVNFVKTYRDPSYSFAGDVQQECFRQRRIELWGEGRNWFDIMRLNVGIDRRGCGFQPSYVYLFSATDKNMLWRIPESEIQANKSISDADNNPAGDTPKPVADVQ